MKKKIEAEPIQNPVQKILTLGLSSGLGLGYAPVAPGTFGSLLGIPAGLLALQYPGWMSAIVIAILIFATAPVVERACKHWGEMDSGKVVWDEVLGQAIALLGMRGWVLAQESTSGFVIPPWESIVVAFLAFRVFDIFKPFPARSFDNRDNGQGVILDDIVAGLYAALIVWAFHKMHWF